MRMCVYVRVCVCERMQHLVTQTCKKLFEQKPIHALHELHTDTTYHWGQLLHCQYTVDTHHNMHTLLDNTCVYKTNMCVYIIYTIQYIIMYINMWYVYVKSHEKHGWSVFHDTRDSEAQSEDEFENSESHVTYLG